MGLALELVLCVLAWMQSSLGVCRAGSELEESCASVLVMWIVCELCCWIVSGLLSSLGVRCCVCGELLAVKRAARGVVEL